MRTAQNLWTLELPGSRHASIGNKARGHIVHKNTAHIKA